MNSLFKNIDFSKVLDLNNLISYQEGQVISRTIAQISSANITLFSLDKGEGISTHVTSGDAMVQILDGTAEITIGNNVFNVKAGETIIMPSDIPHGLEAREKFKMLLTVIKH
ncbi:MAG: cupin domain-containing protein [Clostridium sp.]|jgi:quercetin dioxygenase-like cupin family protein|uniref:cupin domain-containing protein n=1 Tax=Clostridium sp. TaxID=1506 RepID=UPI0025B95F0B|nr:cupin domain-containing protein [Clostridium sp.]MCH3963151.1 cupin domain-containing protein [Clostridium sp.]MCI1716386.1 cupin domain-containing protein [Clostridium sp.]MCI1800726.1 cupin domain-containing protein [Clostridium sp.]MCI1814619.1 cupin domain-containing protein [Clostridium sp.]MCI1871529.1 cupin domain-containing protein [Clostridium sp.]